MPHKRAREHSLCAHYTSYHIYYSYQWSYRHIIYPNYDTHVPTARVHQPPGRGMSTSLRGAGPSSSWRRQQRPAVAHAGRRSHARTAQNRALPTRTARAARKNVRPSVWPMSATPNKGAARPQTPTRNGGTSGGLRWWVRVARVRSLKRAIKHTRRFTGWHATRREGAGMSVHMQAGGTPCQNLRAQRCSKYSSSRRPEDINL
jgi:hypothetical protein